MDAIPELHMDNSARRRLWKAAGASDYTAWVRVSWEGRFKCIGRTAL